MMIVMRNYISRKIANIKKRFKILDQRTDEARGEVLFWMAITGIVAGIFLVLFILGWIGSFVLGMVIHVGVDLFQFGWNLFR